MVEGNKHSYMVEGHTIQIILLSENVPDIGTDHSAFFSFLFSFFFERGKGGGYITSPTHCFHKGNKHSYIKKVINIRISRR
jgi:hypothetical protein